MASAAIATSADFSRAAPENTADRLGCEIVSSRAFDDDCCSR